MVDWLLDNDKFPLLLVFEFKEFDKEEEEEVDEILLPMFFTCSFINFSLLAALENYLEEEVVSWSDLEIGW